MLLRWGNLHRYTQTASDSMAPGESVDDESASQCHAPRAAFEKHLDLHPHNAPDTDNRCSILSGEYAVFPPRLLAGRRTNPPRLNAAQCFLSTARAEKGPGLRTFHPCGHSSQAAPCGVFLHRVHNRASPVPAWQNRDYWSTQPRLRLRQ